MKTTNEVLTTNESTNLVNKEIDMTSSNQRLAAVSARKSAMTSIIAQTPLILAYIYMYSSAYMTIYMSDQLTAQSTWIEGLRVLALFSCTLIGLFAVFSASYKK